MMRKPMSGAFAPNSPPVSPSERSRTRIRGSRRHTTPLLVGNDRLGSPANFATTHSVGGRNRTLPVGSFSRQRMGIYDAMAMCMNGSRTVGTKTYAGAPGDGSAWIVANCSSGVLREELE